jgi:hypothetical protein
MRFITFLLCAITLGRVGAWEIVATRTSVVSANQSLSSLQDITFKCDANDFDVARYYAIQRSDGIVANLTVYCGRPEYHYHTALVGWVPRDGTLYMREVCQIRDLSNALGNSTVKELLSRIPAAVPIPMRRRLLKYGNPLVDIIVRLFEGPDATCDDCITQLGLDQRISETEEKIQKQLEQQRKNLTEAQNKLTKEQNRLDQQAQEWRLNATAQDENLQKQIDAVNNKTNQIVESYLDNFKTVANLTQQIGADIKSLSDQIITSDIKQAELEAYINRTDETMKAADLRIVDAMMWADGNISARIKEVIRDYQSLAASNFQHIRTVNRYLTETVGVLRKAIERRVEKRALTKSVQEAFDTIDFDNVVVFLKDLGRPGVRQDTMPWFMTVDTLSIIYLVKDVGIIQGRIVIFDVMCDSRKIAERARPWGTWDGIFEDIGPKGCDYGDTENATCTCYIKKTAFKCAADEVESTYELATPVALACNPGASHSVIDEGTYWTDAEEFRLFLLARNKEQNEGEFATYPASVVSKYNARAISTNLTDYETGVASPTGELNIVQIMNARAGVIVSPTYALMRNLEVAYTRIWLSIDALSALIDGIIPTGLTFNEIPFTRVANKDASCIQAYWMTYAPDLVPVFRLDAAFVQTGITIDVDGVQNTDYNVLLANPLDTLLPNNYYTIGYPNGSVVYDVAQQDISLSPSPFGRGGTVTYTISSGAQDFTQEAWEARNGGIPFDATEGSNVAAFYERTKSGQVCGGVQLAQAGGWCNILDNYNVQDNLAKDGIILLPKNPSSGAAYQATVTVPSGDIVSLTFSECPLVNVIQPSSNGKTLVLTSNRHDGVTITFDVVITGCRQALYASVAVLPQQSREVWMPACTSVDKTQIVDIFYYNEHGVPIKCQDTMPVVIDREDTITNVGLTDKQYVDTKSLTEVDSSFQAAAEISMELSTQMGELAFITLKAFADIGLYTNVSIFGDLYDFARQRNQTNARILEIISNAPSGRGVYTDILNLFDANGALLLANNNKNNKILEDLVAAFQATQDQQKSRLLDMAATISNLTYIRALVDELNDAYRNTTASIALSTVQSLKQTVLQQSNIVNALNKRYNCGGWLGCALGGGFIRGIGGVLNLGKNLIEDGVEGIADLGEGVIDLTGDVIDGAKDLAKDLGKFIVDTIDKAGNFPGKIFGGLMDIVLLVVIGIVAIVAAKLIWDHYKGKGGVSQADFDELKEEVERLKRRQGRKSNKHVSDNEGEDTPSESESDTHSTKKKKSKTKRKKHAKHSKEMDELDDLL